MKKKPNNKILMQENQKYQKDPKLLNQVPNDKDQPGLQNVNELPQKDKHKEISKNMGNTNKHQYPVPGIYLAQPPVNTTNKGSEKKLEIMQTTQNQIQNQNQKVDMTKNSNLIHLKPTFVENPNFGFYNENPISPLDSPTIGLNFHDDRMNAESISRDSNQIPSKMSIN